MRNILEALRLHQQAQLSNRQIGQALGIAHTTVSDYLRRAEVANISYETGLEIGHELLEQRLFPDKPGASVKRPQPDWAYIHTELKRKHVTMDLLWHEYKQTHVEGLQYSSFCENYRKWAAKRRTLCNMGLAQTSSGRTRQNSQATQRRPRLC